MATPALALSRDQVLGFRRRAAGLDHRLPAGSLPAAARPGLQDSVPRAAVLSLHARVEGVAPDAWSDPSLVQVWGPRFSVFTVAATDRAVFTLGRLPIDPQRQRRAEEMLARLRGVLGDEPMDYREAGHLAGVPPNSLRYAAPTGCVLLRWDGAARPTIRIAERPDVDPDDARLALARRHLEAFGPTTREAFATWAGLRASDAERVYRRLAAELLPVGTPVGDRWLLARDEQAVQEPDGEPAAVRLLPSGDALTLLWGHDRELLVPDAGQREQLWTPRVWPGAILLDGRVSGTWRRSGNRLTARPWWPLTTVEREAVEQEASALPLPGPARDVVVEWASPH